MITSISKLKHFGIFRDYVPSRDLKPFTQYNLFYGWNGSGKSTLAKVFLSISDKVLHRDFLEGEFSISFQNSTPITHKNLSQNNTNIRVFNGDFIERNVNFEQSQANSILILSEEKKEELEKYKSQLTELVNVENSHNNDSVIYTKQVDDLKKNLSKWASSIKKSFELIETSNSYYLNYDRTKLSTFIKEQREKISSTSVLSQEKVKDLKAAIKPSQKPDIKLETFQFLDTESILIALADIEVMISTNILSKRIERLTTNSDINKWVQEGINIHSVHGSENCEFCGQNIPKKRLEELNGHFSEEYEQLQDNIEKAYQWVSSHYEAANITIPDTAELYDELHAQFEAIRINFGAAKSSILSKLEEIQNKINSKRQNPFNIIDGKCENIKEAIDNYNNVMNGVVDLVAKHNLKNQGFEDAIRKSQFALELHFVSDILITEKYSDIEKGMKERKDDLDKKEADIIKLKGEVSALEAILLNEAVGADEFNKNLGKFIGRKDLSLEFDRSLKGYKLIRKGKTTPAKNLSEGEKTAIAFVYFISKLKENGNQIENTIIVLDDPISSFDSNHLFHSYSYLKKECEKANQLFILTHNFQYFKLLRDWLVKKNERKRLPDGTFEEKIRTSIYSVDCTVEEDRKASINNASKTLLDYNSEYHYIFQKLLSLKEIEEIDLEKAFLIANLSRKLLESFLTFKFPKGRNDFSQLLQAGCSDPETREKVYRFINKYSHNQVIDFNDGPIDNLLGEGNNIIHSVMKIVEDLDTTHFLEMSDVCLQ